MSHIFFVKDLKTLTESAQILVNRCQDFIIAAVSFSDWNKFRWRTACEGHRKGSAQVTRPPSKGGSRKK